MLFLGNLTWQDELQEFSNQEKEEGKKKGEQEEEESENKEEEEEGLCLVRVHSGSANN